MYLFNLIMLKGGYQVTDAVDNLRYLLDNSYSFSALF